MNPLGVFLILPGLVFGVQSLPSTFNRHNGLGRFGLDLASTLKLHKDSDDLLSNVQTHQIRGAKDMHLLKIYDPLDCLSQVICGLNTYVPQKPSVRTNTANDFAFLLKNSIAKLRSQKPSPTTTTTTIAPATRRPTTKAPLNDDDDDDEDDEDSTENDYEADELEDYYDGPGPYARGDIRGHHRVKRYSIFSKRRGENEKKKVTNNKKNGKVKSARSKKKSGKKHPNVKKFRPTPRPLTALDKLRMETDLRAKLLSDAKCVNGLIDHSCPFNYQQMLVLMSTSLERERTISFNSDAVLPMVGYLIKSRNYTGTLQATFAAIEKINNYTIEADRENKPIDFTHILDEVMNRQTGDNGLRIVDTSNDSASTSVWEDDEFEHVLQHPYERKRPPSDNYKLDKKKREQELQLQQKKKKEQQAAEDDQSKTSEEDTSEEGLVFDRARPPPNGPGDGESSSEEDDANQEYSSEKKKEGQKKTKKKISVSGIEIKSMVPGPVFGFSHLQKSAEDE